MPQIRQYEQQVNAAGPANVQQANASTFGGNVGDAVRGFGSEISNAADVLYRREVQNDVSDVDSKVSNARAKLTTDLLDQKQKGTLDVDQFKAHVDETLDAASQDIKTNEGQNLFNRHKAAAQLEFTRSAIEGAADLAGKKTVANYRDAENVDIGILANDPSQRDTLLAKRRDWVDSQVQSGLLQADQADKLKLDANQVYAEAAMRGTARFSPELAQKQLDNPSDPVNNLLGETGRYKMQIEVQHYQNSKNTTVLKMQKAADDAAAAKAQEIQSGWYDKLAKNQLSADEVNFGPQSKDVDWQDKKKFIDMMRARQEEGPVRGDGPGMTTALANIWKPNNDPTKTVHTEDDLRQMYLNKQLSFSGFQKAQAEFARNSSGATAELNAFKKSNLWKDAYNQIAKPNAMGIADPQGLHNFNMWQTETMDKIHNGQKDGSFNNSWLTDEKNDNYLGNFSKYQRSMDDIIKDQAARISNTHPDTGEEMVQVVNPSGVSGKIPKSKLQEKLKAGYKQVGK